MAHQITSLTPDKRRITKDIISIKCRCTNNEIRYSKKEKHSLILLGSFFLSVLQWHLRSRRMQRGLWGLHQGRLLFYTIPIPPIVSPLHRLSNLWDGIETQGRNYSGGLWCRSRKEKRGGGRWPRGRVSPGERETCPSFFSFGSITGRDNKALSLSLWYYLPFVQEDSSTTTSSSLIPTARAHTHTVVGGRRKSFFSRGSCSASFGLQSTNPATCYLIGNPLPTKERGYLLLLLILHVIHHVTSFLLQKKT